tara:strand:- start:566 stop:1834 length:1269 start_codon:yes stop_codon:yes gene_type:complete
MDKVLIISYFFSPCNFVGGERTDYWAKNLYKEDIYPIVLTRNWNYNQKDIVGRVSNNKYRLDKNTNREIHYLKHKFQARDLLKNINLLRKILTLSRQILFYLAPKSIPYYNIYLKAHELLSNNRDIKNVIVSGKPFEAYFFGYQLKKEFPHISWIPDYRDQWNTYPDELSKSRITKLFSKLEKKLEKKWTSNCSYFLTTTPKWAARIEGFIMKKGVVILNGFNGNLILENQTNTNKFLKIIYAGTLYPNQNIEVFLKCISEINQGLENKIEIEFIGIEVIKSQRYRVEKISKDHVGKIIISPRVSKKELHIKMLSADLLFLTSFDNVQGWYPVKLFEYSKYPSPIILFPSDNGIMEDYIKTTGTGYVIKSPIKLKEKLIQLIKLKNKNQEPSVKKNKEELFKFSRSNQTMELARVLKNKSVN